MPRKRFKRFFHLYYPLSVSAKNYNGSCNGIDKPCSKLCVPNQVKDMNIKVFNLISRVNETRFLTWQESYARKCKLDSSLCNDRRR